MQNQTSSVMRSFSVELKSKSELKNVALTNGSSDSVLLEGTIGELIHAKFAEGIILEVIGKDRVLRIDLGEEEIQKTPKQNTRRRKINEKIAVLASELRRSDLEVECFMVLGGCFRAAQLQTE